MRSRVKAAEESETEHTDQETPRAGNLQNISLKHEVQHSERVLSFTNVQREILVNIFFAPSASHFGSKQSSAN